MDEPTVWHEALMLRIAFALQAWSNAAPGRGAAFIPVNVRLDELNVFGPDISWLREERRSDRSARWIGAPDLAVEVRSPSTWHHDIGPKRRHSNGLATDSVQTDGRYVCCCTVARRGRPTCRSTS